MTTHTTWKDAAFQVRLLTVEDAGDYRSIRLAALLRAPDAFGSVYEEDSLLPISSWEARLNEAAVFGAYAGPRIAGLTRFAADAGPKERHKGRLLSMFVGPEFRRQGVGAALVQAVVDFAAGRVEQLLLDVDQSNCAALALYNRFGFEAYGVEPRAWRNPGGFVDATLMVKFLDPRPQASASS